MDSNGARVQKAAAKQLSRWRRWKNTTVPIPESSSVSVETRSSLARSHVCKPHPTMKLCPGQDRDETHSSRLGSAPVLPLHSRKARQGS